MSKIPIEQQEAQFDANAKIVLSNVQILARILKLCIPEFQNENIAAIVSQLKKDDIHTDIPLDSDESNPQRIRGENTENKTYTEGTIQFDLLINIKAIKTNDKYLVDIEMQRNQKGRVYLLKRMIFYVSRMISMQKTVEFEKDNYDKICTCYSIWILPFEKENYIKKGNFHFKTTYGETQDEDTELATIYEIGLGNNKPIAEDKSFQEEILNVLYILFKERVSAKMKLEILKQFDIHLNSEELKGVSKMTGWVEGYKELGREEGIKEGQEKIILEMLKNNVSIKFLSENTKIPENTIIQIARHKIPSINTKF